MRGPILVPLDGSAFGEQALPLAIALARRTDAPIQLVKVHVPPPHHVVKVDVFLPPLTKDTVHFDDDVDDTAREQEESYLAGIADPIRRTTVVRIKTSVLSGQVAPALAEFARDCEASLVVMTSHGRGGLSRAWFGNVADALVRHLDVPVLLVRPQGSPEGARSTQVSFHHILVPLDGSVLAEHAIVQAMRIGALFDARYTLLQVVAPAVALLPDAISAPLMFQQTETEPLLRAAVEYLGGVAADLQGAGFQVETAAVIQLQSAAGILEEAAARHADLIVMCTHGRGGWQRFALGSVADKVLRGASVPVLVLRAEAAAQGRPEPVVKEALM